MESILDSNHMHYTLLGVSEHFSNTTYCAADKFPVRHEISATMPLRRFGNLTGNIPRV